MIYKVAWFLPDRQTDTNQWPIDPSERPASHGGAGYMITLGQAEIDLIKRVNSDDPAYPWERKKQWCCHEEPGYLYVGNPDAESGWRWPMIVMGSGGVKQEKYNVVNVLDAKRGKRKIESIPVLDNYDHLSPRTHPHLFHRVIVTNPRGDWDSPVGVFWMPLFSPYGRKHPKGELTGSWIRSAYVGEPVGPVDVEPPPATHKVIVLRRTVLRQGPSDGTAKLSTANTGEVMTILEVRNGWGLTVRGWLNLEDAKSV